MNKFWLLSTLLIGGLLLAGCNYDKEEFSEYWLLAWPNWTITIEDFEKEWIVVNSENFEEWEMCNTPELACVPIILKGDNTLITPHEYNITPIEEWREDNIYFTDLKTFRKVTWLKEASPDYVQQYSNLYSFDPYTEFYKTREEKEKLIKSCNDVYDPVCWNNWKVYTNWCYLYAAWFRANNSLWVSDNTCKKLNKEDINWFWSLKWFNNIEDLNNYNLNTNLTISNEWIYAKFCNEFWNSGYSLEWNILKVNEVNHTETTCEWGNWELLMNIEKDFTFLNGSIIVFQWNILNISTSKWAHFIFERLKE